MVNPLKQILLLTYTVAIILLSVDLNTLNIIPSIILLMVTFKALIDWNKGCTLLFSSTTMMSLVSLMLWPNIRATLIALVLLVPLLHEGVGEAGRRIPLKNGASKHGIGYTGILLYALSLTVISLSLIHESLFTPGLIIGLYNTFMIALNNFSLRKTRISGPSEVSIVRGERLDMEVDVENRGFTTINATLLSVPEENVEVTFPRETFLIPPGGKCGVSLTLKAVYIGFADTSIRLLLSDKRGFTRLIREAPLRVNVTPKMRIALEAALRLLSRLPPEKTSPMPTTVEFREEYALPSRRGEYYGTRFYVPGDDVTCIHWKKSVGKRRLIVKEYRRAGGERLIVLADLTAVSYEELDELVYKLLSSIIAETLRNPYLPIGLAVYVGKETVLFKPPLPSRTILAEIVGFFMKEFAETYGGEKSVIEEVPKKFLYLAYSKRLKGLLVEMEVEALRNLLKENPGYNAFLKLSGYLRPPARILLIYGEHVGKHCYPLLEYYAENTGYTVTSHVSLEPEILYEEAKKAPIGLSEIIP